jgi:hypothetical protein
VNSVFGAIQAYRSRLPKLNVEGSSSFARFTTGVDFSVEFACFRLAITMRVART